MAEKNSDKLNDKINLDSIIDYEKEQRETIHKKIESTAKENDKIFLASFKEINEKNMKSFLWQNFSIYNRKPGVDLSPFIILSLGFFTIYGAFTINQLNGQPKTLLEQVLTNNSISLELMVMLVSGIILVIIERFIYKYNPKEWREMFVDKKMHRKPQTMDELHDAIKFEFKNNTEQSKIKWSKLEVKDDEASKNKKKKEKRGRKQFNTPETEKSKKM